MRRIGREEVERVAELAQLALSEKEIEVFAEQLDAILDAAARVQELATEDIPPTPHAVPLTNVLRPDENQPSLPRGKVLQNAPHEQDGHFRVPRIME